MSSLQLGPIVRSSRGHRVAILLVTLQLALGLAIAVASVQIAHYMHRALAMQGDLSDQRLSVLERLSGEADADSPAALARRTELLDRVRAIPGVESAAIMVDAPLADFEHGPDETWPNGSDERLLTISLVGGPGLAGVLGVPLAAGRDFLPEDLGAASTAAILSPQLAARLFPGGAAVGGHFASRTHGDVVVVGVGEHLRPSALLMPTEAYAALYAAIPSPGARSVIAARHRVADGAAVREALRGLPHGRDEAVDVRPAGAFKDRIVLSLEWAVVVVLLVVGTIVVVALIGSVALTVFLVGKRTGEIGLRRALGATRTDVVRHFVIGNMLLTSVGIGLGMLIVLALVPMLQSNQFGFTMDWGLVALTAAAVWILNVLASWIPARRAALIPPSVASREA